MLILKLNLTISLNLINNLIKFNYIMCIMLIKASFNACKMLIKVKL